MVTKAGLTFHVSNGDRLSIIPRSGKCAISNGIYKIDYDTANGSHHLTMLDSSAVGVNITRVTNDSFDLPDDTSGNSDKDDAGVLRTCNTCHGRSCCVTNTCGRCADDCAWVCD